MRAALKNLARSRQKESARGPVDDRASLRGAFSIPTMRRHDRGGSTGSLRDDASAAGSGDDGGLLPSSSSSAAAAAHRRSNSSAAVEVVVGASSSSALEIEPDPLHRRTPLKRLTITSVLTVSVFAAMLGYDIGVMSGALLPMTRDRGLSDVEAEVAVGCLNFVSAAGALGGGVAYDRLGAVKCVVVAISFYAVGMCVIAASYSFAQIFVGRVVCGVGVGLGFAVCPQYIAEISPPAWRGVLVSCFEISINVGLCVGYVANLAMEGLDDSPRWRGLMLLPLMPTAIVVFFAVPGLPESPRWLMKEGAGREREAREVLRATCGEDAASAALMEIKAALAKGGGGGGGGGGGRDDGGEGGSNGGGGGGGSGGDDGDWSRSKPARTVGGGGASPRPASAWKSLLSDRSARTATRIGACTAFFQQANGSEAAVYYVPQVLAAAGVASEHAQVGARRDRLFRFVFHPPVPRFRRHARPRSVTTDDG